MTIESESPYSQPSIEILEPVDSGLYGSVYRAIQQPFGRQVAVKIIKPDMPNAADALAHGKLLARANHPAIVTVYGIEQVCIPGSAAIVPAIIMEWVEGEKFGKHLGRERFTISQAASICNGVLDGIAYLHSIGLCHGDLHLGNVIVLPEGGVKIIDIDANKDVSLARLSEKSQDGAIASDIDYCRGIVFKALRHSELGLSALEEIEVKLNAANSLFDLQQIVSLVLKQDAKSDEETPPVSQAENQPQVENSDESTNWLLRTAKFDCDDDTVIRLLDTQSYFDLLRIPYPSDRKGVLDRFESEGLIVRADQNWRITNLGAMLFAKKLDQFDRLARKATRVIVYDGNSKIKTKADYPGGKGYAVGFQGLVEFVNGLVPSNEVIEQALRRDVKMFPEIAVRELVANALIHQDFTESGMSVMIELYNDRMEISNPGEPFISPERFIDAYKSRNEKLADLMRRLGICEEKGSGVDKVISSVEAFQLPPPDFRVGMHRTSVVLFAHQELEQMDRKDRIRACYQHCCLRYVMNDRMTNQSLRTRFKLPENRVATVSSIITATTEAEKVKLADPTQTSTRYRSYVPYWA